MSFCVILCVIHVFHFMSLFLSFSLFFSLFLSFLPFSFIFLSFSSLSSPSLPFFFPSPFSSSSISKNGALSLPSSPTSSAANSPPSPSLLLLLHLFPFYPLLLVQKTNVTHFHSTASHVATHLPTLYTLFHLLIPLVNQTVMIIYY